MADMPLYRYSAAGLDAVDRTSLAAEQIRERQDLQRVLRQRIGVLGDDLLAVAEEYGLFEDSRQRIDLLALDRKGTLASTEITSTVIWLNDTCNTDLPLPHRAYRLGTGILLDLKQIIPLPEAKDFQIRQRQKGAATAAVRAAHVGRDYTRYDLTIGDQQLLRMSKQAAVKIAIQELHRAGAGLAKIKSVTRETGGWRYIRQPARRPRTLSPRVPIPQPQPLWYDPAITEDDTAWVIPRFGGRRTERILDGLASVAQPHTTLE
jgi:hypothetical protein